MGLSGALAFGEVEEGVLEDGEAVLLAGVLALELEEVEGAGEDGVGPLAFVGGGGGVWGEEFVLGGVEGEGVEVWAAAFLAGLRAVLGGEEVSEGGEEPVAEAAFGGVEGGGEGAGDEVMEEGLG